MEISEANRYIKENLYNFLEGSGSESFDDNEMDRIIRLGFIMNNLYLEEKYIIFEYSDTNITISTEMVQDSFMTYDDMIFYLMSIDDFEDAYKQFRKHYNRNKVIKEVLDGN